MAELAGAVDKPFPVVPASPGLTDRATIAVEVWPLSLRALVREQTQDGESWDSQRLLISILP
jgi:hypothetical protein